MGICDNPQPGSVTFTYAQLEYLWNTAGGNPQDAAIAAAIAMHESRGESGATDCDSNGTIDRGLWQINSVHGSLSTYDVMGNARAAVQISNKGSDWSAWSSFANGGYLQFLQTGVAPSSVPINATNAQANNTSTQADLTASVGPFQLPSGWGLINPFDWYNTIIGGAQSSITNAIVGTVMQGVTQTILNPLLSGIAGVLGVTAGGIMVLFGLFVMVRNTETEQRMERGISSAAQTAIGLAAPETRSVTAYRGETGTTTVTSARRPARQVRFGGRNLRFGQATVDTSVERQTVPKALNEQAQAYKRTQQPGPKVPRSPIGKK